MFETKILGSDLSNPIIFAAGESLLPNSSGTTFIGSLSNPFGGVCTSTLNSDTLVRTRFMEEPTGLINGINKVFNLTNSPYGYSLALYKNGFLMLPSGVNSTTMDYMISSNAVTFLVAPVSGATIIAQSYGYLG